MVAPHAGAWIEMTRARCLKATVSVAPHAGAWIEIFRSRPWHAPLQVAPHAGAWIEIPQDNDTTWKPYASLPMRERGLK